VAYGIEISSRDNRESQIQEMANFAEASYERSLASYVKSLFYDSKSNCCSFEFIQGVDQYGPIAGELLEIARETIGQFEWFGVIEHGVPLGAIEKS